MYTIRMILEDRAVYYTRAEDLDYFLQFKPGKQVQLPMDKQYRTVKQVKVKRKDEPPENYRDIEVAAGGTQAWDILCAD